MSPIVARSLTACLFIAIDILLMWSISSNKWGFLLLLLFSPALIWGVSNVYDLAQGKRRTQTDSGKEPTVALGMAIDGIVLIGFLIIWLVWGVVSGRDPLFPHSDPSPQQLSLPEAR